VLLLLDMLKVQRLYVNHFKKIKYQDSSTEKIFSRFGFGTGDRNVP
jgi:hypothetical protein